MSPESPAAEWYSYAVIRVVPRVEREEFINVGVIVYAPARRWLCARIRFNRERVLTLDPHAEIELIARHLATFEAVCKGTPESGPIGELPVSERFHWLASPRSTVVQVSPVHEGRTDDLEATLTRLFEQYVGSAADHC